MDRVDEVGQTRRWIADIVVGLNLCPFARRPFEGDLIRYAVTAAADAESLWGVLADELRLLAATPPESVETTLLIHPHALADFLDYNDFVTEADGLVADLGLRGVVQLAGFHPAYRFAGTAADAVENYTNRSPLPMIHLLREDSITAVNRDPDRVAEIPERNIETMRRLGLSGVRRLLRGDPP